MTRQGSPFQDELNLYFKARFSLINVVTVEEERVLKEVADACFSSGRPVYSWDIADGFVPLTEATGPVGRPAKDPVTALEIIVKLEQDAVFVLKDFHRMWERNPQVVRKLKNVVQTLKQTRKNIIVTSCRNYIPEELADQVYVIDFEPPDFEGMKQILDTFTRIPNVRINLTELGREKLARSALGLTANQAQRVFSKAIVTKGSLDEQDIDLVTGEKKEHYPGKRCPGIFRGNRDHRTGGGARCAEAMAPVP